jgi:hypothetical protein
MNITLFRQVNLAMVFPSTPTALSAVAKKVTSARLSFYGLLVVLVAPVTFLVAHTDFNASVFSGQLLR